MWKPISAMLLLALSARPGSAEEWERHRGQGYAFFAPGSTFGAAALHFGAGGEGLVYRGVAAGAELGYLFPARSFGRGAGLLSVNGSYHLNQNSHWVVAPFVTGGYSLLFRGGAYTGFNLGAGVNYWFTRHKGLRLEFRDHLYRVCGGSHSLEFRVGLAFR